MKFKGTKGRWTFTPQSGPKGHCKRAQIWTTASEEYVASLNGTEDEEEAYYNAKVMTSAPRLAQVLLNLRDDLEVWSDIGETNRNMINDVLKQAL